MSEQLIRRVRQHLANLVARARVTLVDDTMKVQAVQLEVLAGEVRDGCEHVQNYGFTSVPLPPDDAGAPEAVVVFIGGNRDHPLVIAVDDRRWRKKNLQPGESAQYSDEGDYFALLRDRIVELVAGTKFTVASPLLECTGVVDVAGDVKTAGVFKVDGNQVVGPRQGSITQPTGGGTVDAQARTAINAIIAALSPSGHGLTS